MAAYVAHERRRGLRPTSVNSALRILRAALHHAAELELIDHAPRVRALREPEPRPTVLGPSEIQKLFAAADRYLRPVLRLASATACRRGERAALRVEDVLIRERALRVRAEVAKDHRERIIPLNPEAYALACSLIAGRSAKKPLFVARHSNAWAPAGLSVATRRAYLEQASRTSVWACTNSEDPRPLEHSGTARTSTRCAGYSVTLGLKKSSNISGPTPTR